MKARQLTLAFLLVPFFMGSFVVPKKNAEPVPFITFVNKSGEESTKSLTETRIADWKDEVKRAEFKKGEIAVEVQGLVVYVPKDGEPSVWWYTDSNMFMTIIQSIASDYELIPGDRFILDNIKIVGEKTNISPIVHTLK